MSREWRTVVTKTVALVVASAILLAVVFVVFGISESLTKDARFGAAVGAISAFAVCVVVGALEPKLMPDQAVRNSATGTLGNAIIGACVGLITVSVLVTVFVPMMDLITRATDLFLWGALLAALVGWPLGMILGAAIGASWSRW